MIEYKNITKEEIETLIRNHERYLEHEEDSKETDNRLIAMHCTFTSIHFTSCNLSKSVFEYCNFINCTFTDCKMTGANFHSTEFQICTLKNIDLTDSYLTDTTVYDAQIHNVTINSAKLQCLNLFSPTIKNLKGTDTTLQRTHLSDVNVTDSVLFNCSLINLQVTSSSFYSSIFSKCDIDCLSVIKSSFSVTALENNTTLNSCFTGCTFTDSSITKDAWCINSVYTLNTDFHSTSVDGLVVNDRLSGNLGDKGSIIKDCSKCSIDTYCTNTKDTFNSDFLIPADIK